MPRHLVLEDRAQRHAFRNYVRRISASNRRARDDNDLKLFALSFSAFFVCFYTFIL